MKYSLALIIVSVVSSGAYACSGPVLAEPLSGWTDLHQAIDSFDHAGLKRRLSQYQALSDSLDFLNLADKEGHTPFLLALRIGNEKAAKRLAKAGADKTRMDKKGNTALHWAASSGNIEMTRELAQNSESLLSAANSDGDTPLHMLCKKDERFHNPMGPLMLAINQARCADLILTACKSSQLREAIVRIRNLKSASPVYLATKYENWYVLGTFAMEHGVYYDVAVNPLIAVSDSTTIRILHAECEELRKKLKEQKKAHKVLLKYAGASAVWDAVATGDATCEVQLDEKK